jgi:hypothetical protein
MARLLCMRFAFNSDIMNIRSILTLFLFLTATVQVSAQSVGEQVTAAFRVGNHKELSRHFDTKVDMVLLSKENSYSKAQAEVIIKDFFDKNRISGYQVIHQGRSRDGAQYVIGSLTTASGQYRTYVLVKGEGDKGRVQQLRIENSDQ